MAVLAGALLAVTGLLGAASLWYGLPPFDAPPGGTAAGGSFLWSPPSLFAAPDGPPARLAAPLRLEPPYAAATSTSLEAGGTTLELAFVSGLPRDAVCVGAGDRKIPCGLMGRASLQNRLKENRLLCQPVFYSAGDVRYRCFLGRHDLAAIQVRTGWARRDGLLDGSYRDEQAAARRERRGAWSGGWSLAAPARQATDLPAAELRRDD